MMKSLKIRLEVNNKQQTMMFQHCGVARHAWNWGLANGTMVLLNVRHKKR